MTVLAIKGERAGLGRQTPGRPRSYRAAVEDRPWLWLAPLLLLIALFYLYPLFDVIRLSFTDASTQSQGYSYTTRGFAVVLSSPEFGQMVRTTAIFVAASVVGQLVCGLGIAWLVFEGERRRLPGSAFVRAVVLIGWVLPGVVIGIVWKLLLDESGGILAGWLSDFGINNPVFLSAAGPALVWVTIANIWRGTAFSMLMEYSGMKTIPLELFEAATVDGAGGWQKFWHITVPSLRRIMLINLVLSTIATLNTFDMVVPLTGGGPGRATEVIALYVYNVVFVEFALGRGAAVAVIMLLAGLAMTLVYFRLLSRQEAADEP